MKNITQEEFEQFCDVVNDLNDKMADSQDGGDMFYTPFILTISLNGHATIKFMGIKIWNNDIDPREWIDEEERYESLKPFLIKEARKIIDDLEKKMERLINSLRS